MNRRAFLNRAGLLLGGGIIAGPDVLDAFGKLTWRRKYWSGADFTRASILTCGYDYSDFPFRGQAALYLGTRGAKSVTYEGRTFTPDANGMVFIPVPVPTPAHVSFVCAVPGTISVTAHKPIRPLYTKVIPE